MSIAENVAAVRARIEAAAQGRRVLLVAASKMNDAGRVREAVAAGVDACGENRVQELVEKNEQHAYDGAPLHFKMCIRDRSGACMCSYRPCSVRL